MPLSFLNPLIWLGALAVAAPLWLHLRRKQETQLHRFSALRFLEDQPAPRRSPWRPRHLLLLAVRVLALALILAGFAWPYLRGANTLPIRESRVYVLDNTLSRQADGGFFVDRAALLKELNRAGNDLQVAVVELTSVPRIVAGFADDRQTADQRIRELQPSFERGSYLAAFRQANALLNNSLGDKKRIILLGDNQENQWNENIDTPPFLRQVDLDLPKTPAPELPNLSLSEPRVQRIFLGDKSLVNFTVKLTHSGPAKTANCLVLVNGQTILNRSVDLEQQPETLMLQAQWEAEPSAWLKGEASVQGDPDALPGDNRVFFSLAPVVEGKVAVLAQSSYLRLALSPDIMRGEWAARFLQPGNLAAELAGTEDADVLCLESGYLQSAEVRKVLWHYLTNGRGVLLLVNRLTPGGDACLRELGFEPEGTFQAEEDNPDSFQFVFFNHAIFHPFLSSDYGNLMEIRLTDYARLRASAALPLVFSQRGAPLFFQSTKFPGKLFVAAFGLDREHSSWPIHQSFIPFLDLTLQAARLEDTTPASFEPAEVAQWQLPAGSTASEVVLRAGDHEIERAPVEHGRVRLRLPGQPGLYPVTFDDRQQVERIFSVNPSPKESRLVYVDVPAAPKLWQIEGRRGSVQEEASPVRGQVRLAGVLQQRLWWWMMLGGLLALLLEMELAGRKRQTA